MISLFHKYWWTFLLRGVFLTGLAGVLLLNLNASMIPGGYLFSLYLLLEGIFTLIPLAGKVKLSDAWTFMVRGGASLALAITYSLWPMMVALVLPDLAISLRLSFIAVWGLVTGGTGIVEFYRFKNEYVERWTLILNSLMAVALAVMLFLQMASDMMTLLWMIFGFTCIFSLSLIIFGLQCLYEQLAGGKG
jgi:uncharacterized membrane protein HdeD (DUF308 family)